jgi:HAD superfamily hydrolase (TIGR01509 family)
MMKGQEINNFGKFADYDGFIFDLDGTLVDSMYYWVVLPENWLRERGIPVPKDLEEQMGMCDMWQASVFFAEKFAPRERAEDIFEDLLHVMDKHYAEDIPLMPGADDFLRALKAAGKQVCLATMTDRPLVETVLRANGIADCVDFILTTPEVGVGKDKPDIYRLAAERFGLPKERSVVLEDSHTGAKTALRDGFPVVVMRTKKVCYADVEAERECRYEYTDIDEVALETQGKMTYIDDYIGISL